MLNFNFSFLFMLDPISLFFLFVIFLITLPCAVYSIGYLKGENSKREIILAWVLLSLFVISMGLVVMVRNVFIFLIVWEVMSLVSYFLVIFDTKHEKSIQAGLIYIIMTHIGTAFLIAAFMIMFKYANSFDFIAIKNACRYMPAQVKNIVFLFLLIGFGTKAGLVPLHIWLPYAHPQAQSHISGIMSGVMIKTAIYGIIRFVIFILGISFLWWAVLVLILAAITCLVGVIYALMENDLKRLLAYSSVENIGIILLGIGLSMFFLYMNLPYLAVFSLIAGLYHLINHAVFKGLLFLCAGSVYKATGTRDIEKLGGLIKRMPQTAFCFLLGAMAISALPPLNGFVSEWLIFQSFFLGAVQMIGGYKLFLGISASMLALTSGLAAACFVKAFGVTFLALPRSSYVLNAKEVSLSMRAGMFFLSFFVVILGLSAVFVMKLLAGVAGSALGIDISTMSFSLNNFVLSPQPGQGAYLSLPLLAGVLIILGIAGFAVYKLFNSRKAAAYKTWDCGYYKIDARNEYSATAFSKPFRIAFSFFLQPYHKTQKIRNSFYHVKSFVYETRITLIFKKYVYDPLISLLFLSAKFTRRLQPGSIHVYLGYIFVTVVLLIIFRNRF